MVLAVCASRALKAELVLNVALLFFHIMFFVLFGNLSASPGLSASDREAYDYLAKSSGVISLVLLYELADNVSLYLEETRKMRKRMVEELDKWEELVADLRTTLYKRLVGMDLTLLYPGEARGAYKRGN